jgi:23S rRNA pseudouridine2605 synthase
MVERIQKIISLRGGISRRAAEKLISEGRVTVDGKVAALGDKAESDFAEIHIDSVLLENREIDKIYIMLNKPVGYVTTMSDEKGRKTVKDLVSDLGERVYPIGRLDINSEGLLLMTNDGDFANSLMHPSFEKEKTYRVMVTGEFESGIRRLTEPMELDGVMLSKPKVRVIKTNERSAVFDITIHEGRNRQVRRMCENVGMNVKRLTRISEGGIKLGNLQKGTWRYLTDEEIRRLRGVES